MKTAMVIQVIVLCLVLTIFTIFTIDSVNVRKAELLEIMLVEVGNVVEDYVNGEIEQENLHSELLSAFTDSSSGKYSNIKVSVFHASAEQGIVDFLVEATYDQPNGRPRMLSYKRVYIREKPDSPDAEKQYSFIRTIDAAHYKSTPEDFYPEEKGGLKKDSIWKTEVYESVLDSALLELE